MTLHIIHLSERKDRWQILQNELEEQKIHDYRIWEGIVHEVARIGIAKSHKKIVQFAKENYLPNILIGEDDLKFTAPGAFDFFLNRIPTSFDLYLAGIIYGKIKNDNSVDDYSGTMLYLVNEKFYDQFLSLSEEKHLDRVMASKGKFIVCNPMAAIQHNGYSNNSKRYMNYEAYLKNKALWSPP